MPADTLIPAPMPVAPAADPILRRFDGYRGRFTDEGRGVTLDGDAMRAVEADLGRALARSGARAGGRAVLAVGNGPLFLVALAGCLRAGLSPLLVHADAPAPEIERLSRRWACGRVVSDRFEPRDGDRADRTAQAGEAGRLIVRTLGGEGAPDRFAAAPLHPTSGTTGEPKIAVRPAACALAEADLYARTMGIGAGDAILCATPMSHAYAYGMAVMVPLLTGADCIALPRFNPRLVRAALAADRASILPLVPAMLPMLLQSGWAAGGRLRLVLSAGSPLPAETAAQFGRETGHAPRPLFGTTETGGIAVGLAGAGGSGVGPAMAGVALRLEPTGLADRPGLGRLLVRSPAMMAGYLDGGGIAARPDPDGWHATGDLASLDARGEIHLHGRSDELINVLGHKVVPSEVEAVIRGIPGVAEAKVYAGRHRGADIVCAALVRSGPLAAEDVHRHCRGELVAYKRPTRIAFLDALPRSPSGKILIRDLPEAGPREAAPREVAPAAPPPADIPSPMPTPVAAPPASAGRLLYLMNDFVVQEHLCNLRCTYCLNFENENLKPGEPWAPTERIDLKQGGFGWARAREVIERCTRAGDAPILRLAGGEVMAIKGALDFVEEVAADWDRVQILTNATFLTRDIDRLARIPNLNLCCSLDGFLAEHNRERTPHAKWAQRIIDGVTAAVAAGVPVEIYCVLNRSNVEAVHDFAAWIAALPRRADVRLLPFPVRGDAAATYLFEPTQLGSLERLVREHARFAEILPPRAYLERLLRMAQGAARTHRCRIPLSFLQTFDDGVVAACSNCWATSLGNVLADEGAFEAVGAANIHRLFLRTPPRVSFCRGCFTPFDVVNVYLDGACSLDELSCMDLYGSPAVRVRLAAMRAAWAEGGRAPLRQPLPMSRTSQPGATPC